VGKGNGREGRNTGPYGVGAVCRGWPSWTTGKPLKKWNINQRARRIFGSVPKGKGGGR